MAVEAADIALMTGDLRGILHARDLSGRTLGIIEENFWLATVTNLLGIALGATGWLSPAMIGMVHVGHTLGIMINSSRLLGWKGGASGEEGSARVSGESGPGPEGHSNRAPSSAT